MTGFLIDSLIATGRFDDARACIVLYPEESERFVALGRSPRRRASAAWPRPPGDGSRPRLPEPIARRCTAASSTGVLWRSSRSAARNCHSATTPLPPPRRRRDAGASSTARRS